MKRPKVIKDKNWGWLDESHPVNNYVKELHKYIDYLESKECKASDCESWVSDEEIDSWIEEVNKIDFDNRPVTTKEIAKWYAQNMRQRMAEEFERRMK